MPEVFGTLRLKAAAEGQGVGDVVAVAGLGGFVQPVLDFGTEDEVVGCEVYAKTCTDFAFADVVCSSCWDGGMEQAGEISTSMHCQPRILREAEHDEGFNREVEIGEFCGFVLVVVEDVVGSGCAFHGVEKPGAYAPAFCEEVIDADPCADTHFDVLFTDI